MDLASSACGGQRRLAIVVAGVAMAAAVSLRANDGERLGALAATTVERVGVSYASPGKVWREAEAFAATHSNCDVLVGRGDSMLPLFPDRTVIVVRRTPLAELQVGMTVVFLGDRGRPVAHTLVANSAGGWVAKGLANDEVDRTRVRRQNYIGQVVRAYLPVPPPESDAAAVTAIARIEGTAAGGQ